MTPSRLSRYRAERLLRKDFAGLRSKVLAVVRSQLRGKGIVLDPSDLEACYAQAWHGLYATVLDGEVVESPSAWLVLVTFRRAIDEHRSASRNRLGSGAIALVERADGAGSIAAADSAFAFAPDFAAELDNRDRLRRVFEAMRASLSERECEAASLCYLQGLSRADAAERMGIGEARMRKLMDGSGAGKPGVAGKLGELLDTINAGGWCEQQSSLMRAFAFGVLDPKGERHALAVAHCRECPACRAHVASLRGLASVLPLPLLPLLTLAGGTARAGTGAHGAGTGAHAKTGTGVQVSSTGWSGLTGSLTAKIALTAVTMLGVGYSLFGPRARRSTPTRNPVALHAAASPAVASNVLPRAFPVPLRASSRRPRSTRRSAPVTTHSARRVRFLGEPASQEFSPERTQGEIGARPSVATPEQTRLSDTEPTGLPNSSSRESSSPDGSLPESSPESSSPESSSRAIREFGIE